MFSKTEQVLHDVLNGRMLLDRAAFLRRPWMLNVAKVARAMRRWLAGREYGRTPDFGAQPQRAPQAVSRQWPEDEGGFHSEAGQPAPLHPRPGHHLVAANALPPSDTVYLLPKD